MTNQGFSRSRGGRAVWLALPACLLALAAGGAHLLFGSSRTTTAAEERLAAANVSRPAEQAAVRPVTKPEVVPLAGNAPKTSAPIPTPRANGVVTASALRELPTFASSNAEVTFLRTRLPGAKLEHENWTRSLTAMKSAAAQAESASERAELERRSALLEAKLGQQDVLLAQMEGRIAELEHSGGSQTGAR